MLWQLTVPMGMVLVALISVGAVKFSQAAQVFERIVGQLDEVRADEVSRLRQERQAGQAEAFSNVQPPHGSRTSSGLRQTAGH